MGSWASICAANYRMLQRSPVELVVAVARATGIKLTDLSAATTTNEIPAVR